MSYDAYSKALAARMVECPKREGEGMLDYSRRLLGRPKTDEPTLSGKITLQLGVDGPVLASVPIKNGYSWRVTSSPAAGSSTFLRHQTIWRSVTPLVRSSASWSSKGLGSKPSGTSASYPTCAYQGKKWSL